MKLFKLIFIASLFSGLSAEMIKVYNGWNSFGSSNGVNLKETFSKYNDISIIWSWNNSSKDWGIYFNGESRVTDIQNIECIENFSSFWVYNSGAEKDIELVPNSGESGNSTILTVTDENIVTSISQNNADETINSMPTEEISEDEKRGLLFIREEEKLARDVYLTLYEKWNQKIFYNIAKAEQTHTDAVKVLLDKYNIPDPVTEEEYSKLGVFKDEDLQALYDSLVEKGSKSLVDALEVGATVEDYDIYDIEEHLKSVDNEDIISVYESLVKGSRNHLRSFIKNLENQGQSGTYEPQFISIDYYNEILEGDMERGEHGDEESSQQMSNGNGNQHGKK